MKNRLFPTRGPVAQTLEGVRSGIKARHQLSIGGSPQGQVLSNYHSGRMQFDLSLRRLRCFGTL
jgi:hypothetical protein